MKMAKASEADFDAAFLILHILNAVADPRAWGYPSFPPRIDGEFHEDDPTSFDWEDEKHIAELRERILGAQRKGSLSRVIMCAHTVLSDQNRIVDPDADCLDLHPSLIRREDVERAINDEPELPGKMPDEMFEAISGDRDATEEALRICVRQTKAGILKRLEGVGK